MPTPEEFLSLLEERQLVPEATIELMRKKNQKHGDRVSAKSLAKYLVDTEVLSEEQLEELLSDGSESEEVLADPEIRQLDKKLAALADAAGEGEEEDIDDGSKKRRRSTRHKHLKKAKGNEFDSPLILLGFGGLAVLLVIGGILYYLLNSETGTKNYVTLSRLTKQVLTHKQSKTSQNLLKISQGTVASVQQKYSLLLQNCVN